MLDEFLRTLVNQYAKRKIGRTFVAARPDDARILGYYTLASSSIPFMNMPEKHAKKLPRQHVPVTLLGRVAVDRTMQGQGLGLELLLDALRRCLRLSEEIGSFAVEVRAIDHAAKRFYEKLGFTPLLDDELHLFLPLQTVENVFA